MVLLIGLMAKNGILIVEFAKQRYEEGLSVLEAALEAAKLRLRRLFDGQFLDVRADERNEENVYLLGVILSVAAIVGDSLGYAIGKMTGLRHFNIAGNQIAVLPDTIALLTKLRVCDYDYIVFDLPPTTPTTMTARLIQSMVSTLRCFM